LLIDGVSLHGGDVVKFAGDALQVVWRSRKPTRRPVSMPGACSETDSVRTDTTDGTPLATHPDRRDLSIWSKIEEEGSEALATLILRAAQCCLHLLATLNNFNPPGVSGVSLTLHVGIGERHWARISLI
jgi:class 3 adenylate cyclase